jgi:hypothetical protein
MATRISYMLTASTIAIFRASSGDITTMINHNQQQGSLSRHSTHDTTFSSLCGIGRYLTCSVNIHLPTGQTTRSCPPMSLRDDPRLCRPLLGSPHFSHDSRISMSVSTKAPPTFSSGLLLHLDLAAHRLSTLSC